MPETQESRNSPLKKVSNYIRSLDIYGHPINLLYKDSNTFQSTFGGVFTIISRIGILIYFLLEIKKVVDKDSTITVTEKIINTALNPLKYDLDLNKFDFAVKLNYALDAYEPNINPNMHQYAYVTMNSLSFSFVPINSALTQVINATEMEIVKCPSGRFGGEQETTNVLKIEDQFMCPKNTSFTLYGGWGSSKLGLFIINVRKCKQAYLDVNYPGQKCKNSSEIDRVFKNIQVFVPVMNQFFDQDDFSSNPIKSTVNMLYFPTHPELGQSFNYKIGQNEAVVRDSWLTHSVGEQTLPFYQTRFDQSFTSLPNEYYSTPVTVTFLMDENVKTTVREVYAIGDALASAGGFLGIIVIIVQTLIGNFQQHLFYQSIIRKIFISEDSQQPDQELDKTAKRFTNKISTTNSHMMNEQDNKGGDTFFDSLFQSLCMRHQFIFTLKDYLHGTYFRCCCRKKIVRKYNIYKNGVTKLKKELEITTLLKKMRTTNLISQIFLSNYQKALMPYFTMNMISEGNQDATDKQKEFVGASLNNGLQEDKKKRIKQYLMEAIIQSEKQKVDQRLLKNLDPKLKAKVSSNHLAAVIQTNVSSFLMRDMNQKIHKKRTRQMKNDDSSNVGLSGLQNYGRETKLKSDYEEIDIDQEINDFESSRIRINY